MKYYVVPTEALSFKEEGKVIVPSKAAIEANLLEMMSSKDNDAAMAFTKRTDAEKLANELDPDKKDHEGFVVIEISAPKKDYNEDDVEVTVAEGKTETLDYTLVPYSEMTFVKAHLGHLDKSLKGQTVDVNAKSSDLIERAAKPAVEEPAVTAEPTTDADKAKEPAKTEEASSSFSFKSFAKGLLVTGAFAAAAYASMVSGVTPAILAYFGVKAGFAATLAASAALVAVASTVVYGAVRAATSFVRFVASKFASKAEATTEEKPAETTNDTKEVPDCCKGKACETTVEATAKADVEKTAEAAKTADVAEEAIATKHAKVVSFPKKAAPVVAAKEPEAKAGHRMTMRKR